MFHVFCAESSVMFRVFCAESSVMFHVFCAESSVMFRGPGAQQQSRNSTFRKGS